MSGKESAEAMDHRLERLVFFSDAVFAIAITLLIIEIEVPHLPYGTSSSEFLHVLAENKWHYASFVLSFLVIGRFWVGHHTTMAMIDRYSPKLIWPNMFLLMAIAFMPHATVLLGNNPGQLVPAAIYNATMLVLALCQLWLQRTAFKAGAMRNPFNDDGVLIFVSGTAVVIGALVALTLSFVIPELSQGALILIPLLYRLLAARYRRKVAKTGGEAADTA